MRHSHWVIALALLPASLATAQMAGPNTMSANSGTSLPDSDATDIDKVARTVDEQQAGAASRQHKETLAYRENLRIRRRQAEQYAAAARSGAPLPGDAAETLRNELRADIEQWRGEFGVGRGEWRAMSEQWLVPRDNLTAGQWAQRRVDWWAARDAWIARNRR